uniref:Uncharacterized protein LOC116939324 isoform X2 n=1 Tax=Petromyzon marinus TaxID=7757 RepID=A0AAJ7WMP8_PETMA|nr:uncharacterized protein LOC116939324 isoform X2 [Petromyzon marinus]
MEGDCSQQQQQELLVKALARTVAGGRSLLGGAQAESGEGELQEFVLQKITSLGGMIREYAQLMSSMLVSSRADLEQLWRLHLGKSDVREAVEELLQLEEEWSSFLKGMDERLDIEVTAPGVAEPAVQLPLDLELTDARCGRCLSQRCWVRTLHPCCSCCFVISPDCPDAIMSPGSSLTRETWLRGWCWCRSVAAAELRPG